MRRADWAHLCHRHLDDQVAVIRHFPDRDHAVLSRSRHDHFVRKLVAPHLHQKFDAANIELIFRRRIRHGVTDKKEDWVDPILVVAGVDDNLDQRIARRFDIGALYGSATKLRHHELEELSGGRIVDAGDFCRPMRVVGGIGRQGLPDSVRLLAPLLT